jgi:sugar lactone lactonase YvrE
MKYIILLLTIISGLLFSCKENKKEHVATSVPTSTSLAKVKPEVKLLWQTDTTLRTPESVIFDKKFGTYYVSCINNVPPDSKDKDGYIAKIDQQGKVIKLNWISGLSAPKGMAIKGDTLYVADIDELVIVNIVASKIVNRIKVKGAKFLNDVDVDMNGIVYFSDSYANNIHSYDGKEVKTIVSGEVLGVPNGIYCESDKLVVASFEKGNVYTLNKSNPIVEMKVDTLPGGDGVEKYNEGYLISNWNGEVYYVNNEWKKYLILDTKAEKRNAADIEFVAEQNIMLVPEFFGNRVSAYKLD